jgi:FkbM family methyltransferase
MEVTLAGLAARGFAPSHVVDVGAAAGTWTETALRYWPDASYLLVEPLEERRSELDSLCSRHRNVEWIAAAAGHTAGRLTLNVTRDLDGSSFLYGGVETREVAVSPLDELLVAWGTVAPQLVKLDVQGYELEVLSGAERVLEQGELIVLEAHLLRGEPPLPMLHEVVAWMVERDWRPYELADVLRRPLDGAMAQCDIVFAREGTPLLAVDRWA